MTTIAHMMRRTIAVAFGTAALLTFAAEDASAQARRGAAAPAVPAAEAVSDEVDPLVRESIAELQRNGVIDLQRRVGSDLLVIDRLQRRGLAIKTLMETLGTEGLRQMDPELYIALQDSPIFIAQKIAEVELLRDLDMAIAGPVEAIEPGNAATLGPRSDGSEIFYPAEEEPVEEEPEIVLVPIDSEVIEIAEPVYLDFPISLREIFGSNGVFQAIILHGNEPVRIATGDTLPNDTEILEILADRITVRRRHRVFDIHLRG